MGTDYASLTGDYSLDPAHTTIGFVARHAMVTKVRGGFNEFEGTIHLDGADPTKSSCDVKVRIASIDTRNEQRNGHLLSSDFFEQEKFPEMTFTSTGIKPDGDDEFILTGDLTIKGVTRSVDFEIEYTGSAVDPYGNHRVGFEGKSTVNRRDFGLDFDAKLDAGGLLVSEKIQIELEVSAIKS